MAKPALSPCGSWKSPITAQDIAQSRISFQEILVDQDIIYWVESRPTEQGRYVIVRADEDGKMSDVTPPGYSARTLVNSYGGGSFTLSGGTVYFSNFVASSEESPYARHHDQRLFRQKEGSTTEPLTDTLSVCYADGVYDSQRGRLISVREDGQLTLHGQGMQSLVSIDLVSGQQEMLAYGNDFYAAPRLSPDGKRLCWLTWNYPSMPWDGSELWVADVNDEGMLCNPKQIAGGTEEAIFQPEWSPQGSCSSSRIVRIGGIFTAGTAIRRPLFTRKRQTSARLNGPCAWLSTISSRMAGLSARMWNRGPGGLPLLTCTAISSRIFRRDTRKSAICEQGRISLLFWEALMICPYPSSSSRWRRCRRR